MKKKGTPTDWLREILDDVESRRGEYVKSRFYVVEVTPPKRYYRGDGHGGSELDWTSGKTHIVSGYFPNKTKAEAFKDEHEPDDGNRLEVRQDKLYRRVVEEWF